MSDVVGEFVVVSSSLLTLVSGNVGDVVGEGGMLLSVMVLLLFLLLMLFWCW